MAIATLGLAVQAAAAPPVLIVTDAGYFLMTKDANGVPVAERCTVLLMDKPPIGEPPDPPKPPISNAVADAVYASASAVGDTEGAKVLSVLFQQVSSMLESGSLTPTGAGKAIDLAWPLALAKTPGSSEAAWAATFKLKTDLAISEAQAGRLSSVSDWTTFLGSVAAGLDRAAGPDSAFDISKIIKWILEIIALLTKFGLI